MPFGRNQKMNQANALRPKARLSSLTSGMPEHFHRPMPAKVFISCGQKSAKEEKAAKSVGDWFESKGFQPYVAIEVSTISDLNKQVIAELKSSDYFVFINFAREKILSGKKAFRRGSLYTNQELAVAISLDFTDRMMILVNQRGAEKEGIFKIMVCNTDEFDTFDEVLPIIQKRVSAEGWDKSFSRHLSVDNYGIDPVPVSYRDREERLLRIGHIDVHNSRPDVPASDCAIRLLKIFSEIQGERLSPDRERLKVTMRLGAYQQSIWPNSYGTFDLFGIDQKSYPNTYLLSESDVPRSPILSTREKHLLTYEIFASGFPKVTKEIEVDLTKEKPYFDPKIPYSPSGASTFTQVISDPVKHFYEQQSSELPDSFGATVIRIEPSDGGSVE
jgi:hypothetical protein